MFIKPKILSSGIFEAMRSSGAQDEHENSINKLRVDTRKRTFYVRYIIFILGGCWLFLQIPYSIFFLDNKSKYPESFESPLHKYANLEPGQYNTYTYDKFEGENNRDSSMTHKFVLYRAIGNDLPPRHQLGQAYTNVKWMLDHEPELPGLSKRWVVNRIFDPEQELKIIQLLEDYKQEYIHIPIDYNHYDQLRNRYDQFQVDYFHGYDYMFMTKKVEKAHYIDALLHDKILYIMNNNGVRNTMLEAGKKEGFEYILPWDGNCFLTETMWNSIRGDISKAQSEPDIFTQLYYSVPMDRLKSNNDLNKPSYKPKANEEPQIIFHRNSIEEFSSNMRYGRRPKVELLWRLKVAGPWDKWPQSAGPWERKVWKESADLDGKTVSSVGWVARLYSGNKELEVKGSLVDRGVARSEGIWALLGRVEAKNLMEKYQFEPEKQLLTYKEDALLMNKLLYQRGSNSSLTKLIDEKLLPLAELAMHVGPWSVIDKTATPPSDDKHDYYNPAPYYWPDPSTKDGLPYIRKDGQRVPGTNLHDEDSEKYDRTRLADFLTNTSILTLAGFITDNKDYAKKAAQNVWWWFINQESNMNPNMMYAQVIWGKNKNMGSNYGVIEMKDLYYFLDIIKILNKMEAFPEQHWHDLFGWFNEYRDYLLLQNQGKVEYTMKNNHGTYYDLQMAALQHFSNDTEGFLKAADWSKARMLEQFAEDGSLPAEMQRPTQLHYMMFTLQGWINLARLSQDLMNDETNHFKFIRDLTPKYLDVGTNVSVTAQSLGVDPFLKRCIKFTVPYFKDNWSHYQQDIEDVERMVSLYYMGLEAYPELISVPLKTPLPVANIYEANPLFDVHSGVHPFWNLAVRLEN